MAKTSMVNRDIKRAKALRGTPPIELKFPPT